jgi:Mg-chelatase subunit ChlD
LPWLGRGPGSTETEHADVVIVLDASTSMEGSKLAAARADVVAFAAAMRFPADQVALVAFSELARLELRLAGNPDALIEPLAAVAPSPGTRIDRGLAEAAAELGGSRHMPGNRSVILLLSDGGQVEEPSAARSAAAAARARGIVIYAVGVGADADESILVDIAGGRGQYRFAPTADQMAELYRDIVGQ